MLASTALLVIKKHLVIAKFKPRKSSAKVVVQVRYYGVIIRTVIGIIAGASSYCDNNANRSPKAIFLPGGFYWSLPPLYTYSLE